LKIGPLYCISGPRGGVAA